MEIESEFNAAKKITEVKKLDRAFREMLFKKKEQIKCFDYLTTDYNFWSTYEEITKEIAISRYHYKQVKDYIIDELNRIKII